MGFIIYEIFIGESPNKNRLIDKEKRILNPFPDISKEKLLNEINKIIFECCNEKSEENQLLKKEEKIYQNIV